MANELGGEPSLPAECRRRYRAERTLGAGGFGTAVLARDLELSRFVVFKLLDPQLARDPDAVARFHREARLTARIAHENVVKVLDHGVSDGTPWIAYEFIEGRSLRERLDTSPPAPAEAVEIALELARALEAAHAAGIVHRDVKPENVLEAAGRPRLIDFGIAKGRSTGATVSTRPGVVLGSPGYLSPEAIQGEEVDGRGDLYSLGVVLYEMLAGRPPFTGDNTIAVLEAHLSDPPPPLAGRAGVSRELEAVVMRLLEKKPAKRFASAGELASALSALAPPAGRDAAKPPSRSRALRARSGSATMPVSSPARSEARASPGGIPSPASRDTGAGLRPAPRLLALVPAAIVLAVGLVIAAGPGRFSIGRPAPPPTAGPPERAARSADGLAPGRAAALDAQVQEVGARITGRTKARLKGIKTTLLPVTAAHCREAAADYRWLETTARALEAEFPQGFRPRDLVLVSTLYAKRYTQRAILEDAKADLRLLAMSAGAADVYDALGDEGQGGTTLNWLAHYLNLVPPALDAMAADDGLFRRAPGVLLQLHEVCRSAAVYHQADAFARPHQTYVQKMLAALESRARRGGRAATLAKLAILAWRRGSGQTLPKLAAVHEEAGALIDASPDVPAPMRGELMATVFPPR